MADGCKAIAIEIHQPLLQVNNCVYIKTVASLPFEDHLWRKRPQLQGTLRKEVKKSPLNYSRSGCLATSILRVLHRCIAPFDSLYFQLMFYYKQPPGCVQFELLNLNCPGGVGVGWRVSFLLTLKRFRPEQHCDTV